MRAPLRRLIEFADRTAHRLELDPAALRRLAREGDAALGIRPVRLNEDRRFTPPGPYEAIYGR